MKKISIPGRLILVAAGHLAGYQIVTGVEGLDPLPMIAYTIAFGVLVLACLLILIMGYRALDNAAVVIISTLIPLGLSTGMVGEHAPRLAAACAVLAAAGFALVVTAKLVRPGLASTAIVTSVHGLAGLLVSGLPLALCLTGERPPGYALVGLGGMVVGAMGLLLALERFGKPLASKESIYRAMPVLLLVISALFVAGLNIGVASD